MQSIFIKNFNKLTFKNLFFIWLVGLLFPFLYGLIIINFKRVVKSFESAPPLIWILLLFIPIQLISLLLSINSEYYSNERFFAMIHNILAYSFVFLGYSFLTKAENRILIRDNIGRLFWVSFIAVIFLSIISIFFKNHLSYGGILGLIGISSKFTTVNFFMLDYYMWSNFPRTTVLSVYPNATAISLFLVHSIYIFLNFNKLTFNKKILSHLALIVIIFMTGSRLYFVLSVILLISIFISSRKRLLITILTLIITLPLVYLFFQFLYSSRSGSNAARIIIYIESIKYMIKNNIVFGLGLKPRIPELLNLPYPIGSHSTLLGYFIKNGLLGGLYMLLLYLLYVVYYLASIIRMLKTKHAWSTFSFYINTVFLILLVMSLTEDLDVFELIPFFIGIVLWIILNKKL
jgi:hypothetical protein